MRPSPALPTLAAVLVASLVAPVASAALAAQTGTAPLDRRIDSVFAAFSRTTTPGCAVGVDRGGAPLLRRAYGMANLESGTPFAVSTISESGSVAKQFLAASIVMLALDGVLSLDDDVSRWVPEVKGVGKRITVRQLLSHTSGLPDRYTLHEAQGRAAGEVDHPNAEVLHLVSRLRDLNFDPGEDYLYSNTGYIVAVAVLERASGRSLQAFTQERIFAPLGMTDTHWREDHRVVVPRRAAAYRGNANSGWRNDHPFTRVHGAGGLNVTVDDFLKWSAAFQSGAGRWGAIRDSMSAVIRLNEGTAITYGLGVTTDIWRGVPRVSHTGSTGGYRAALYRFPSQAVSVALLCNSGAADPGGLASSVSAIVLGEALAPAPAAGAEMAPMIAIPAETLMALAGRYHAARTEEFLELEVRDGQLATVGGTTTLVPLGGDRFRVRGQPAELQFTRVGSTPAVTRRAPGARAVDYARVDPPVVNAAAIGAFAGAYRSPELDASMTLVALGDTLVVDQGWRGQARLKPLFRDGFEMPGGERIRFTRDARGRITGFVAWAGRVRHLRFERVTTR